jgi:hypothetical protein
MSAKSNNLRQSVVNLRTYSDGLVSAGAGDRAITGVKDAQNRVNESLARLTTRSFALLKLSEFNNDPIVVDWSEVRTNLTKAEEWLESELTSWQARELVALADSISTLTLDVQEKITVQWEKMLQRVFRVRALLEFFSTAEAMTLVFRSKIYLPGATPKSMLESIDFLKEAEAFAEVNGVADPEIARFLEGTTSPGGSPIDSLDSDNVRDWLKQENRITRFGIRFKDGDV